MERMAKTAMEMRTGREGGAVTGKAVMRVMAKAAGVKVKLGGVVMEGMVRAVTETEVERERGGGGEGGDEGDGEGGGGEGEGGGDDPQYT